MHISINGIDTVGKSTQIMLLPLLYPGGQVVVAPPLKRYVPELSKPAKESFRWWMDSEADEFTRRIAEGLAKREAETTDQLVIVDRGTEMFKAVCVAKWMLQKRHPSLPTMFEEVSARFASSGITAKDGAQVLLVKNEEYDQRTSSLRSIVGGVRLESGNFTDEENLRYASYQTCLKQAVAHMARQTRMLQVVVDSSIVNVQNRLRTAINQQLGGRTLPFPKLGESVEKIVGLSGLSESGKSTRAEILVQENNGFRLKLRFFELLLLDGKISEEESMAIKLLLFTHVHYYRSYFTVESIHGIKLAAYLKLFFGGKFELEYLDTSRSERVRRWAVNQRVSLADASSQIDERDRLKEQRGCSGILSIADTVIRW